MVNLTLLRLSILNDCCQSLNFPGIAVAIFADKQGRGRSNPTLITAVDILSDSLSTLVFSDQAVSALNPAI